MVVTSHSLKNILETPSNSSRLSQIAIKLSEVDIQYIPQNAIKGKAMEKFIVEWLEVEDSLMKVGG